MGIRRGIRQFYFCPKCNISSMKFISLPFNIVRHPSSSCEAFSKSSVLDTIVAFLFLPVSESSVFLPDSWLCHRFSSFLFLLLDSSLTLMFFANDCNSSLTQLPVPYQPRQKKTTPNLCLDY